MGYTVQFDGLNDDVGLVKRYQLGYVFRLRVSPTRRVGLGVESSHVLENSIGRRGSLEERGGEYGEILLKYMSMCSTLMEELCRGSLRSMGC